MPLRLPDKLPAINLLKKENIFVMDNTRATSQDIRPLRIVILNLMPLKITTETDLVRLLSNTPLQMEIYFMKLKSHTSKNTPIEHMMMFYKDFDVLAKEKFDGMIITGAPIEHLEFEEVEYWEEISKIFAWADTHVTSTMYICWAAQGCSIITESPNIICPKRCLASSSNIRYSHRYHYSVVLTTISVCLIADILRLGARILISTRSWRLWLNRQKVV